MTERQDSRRTSHGLELGKLNLEGAERGDGRLAAEGRVLVIIWFCGRIAQLVRAHLLQR